MWEQKMKFQLINFQKLIKGYIGYNGKVLFDKSSPDGTYRKNLDSNKINSLGWEPIIDFKKGLKKIIDLRKENLI